MELKQYYLGCLAHASYLLADTEAGTAIVVDPQRDVDRYLADAAALGVRITDVVLTHFHADFVAGHLELRDRTGAAIRLGPGARTEYEHLPLREGDAWDWPTLRVEVLETPGHTPEMVNLVVYDKTGPEPGRPHAVLTGDTLFNGDVGRPDLLASIGHTKEELADRLYDSLQKLMRLPDGTLVYPAHGAGSLCGKALGGDTVTTIGAQRAGNYALQARDKAEFLRLVTEDQSPAPAYFVHDAAMNREEHADLRDVVDGAEAVDVEGLERLVAAGAQVVDTRDDEAFARGHLPGSVNVGLDGTYATWCGSVLGRDRPIVVVADPDRHEESIVRLGRIGYDHVVAHLDGGFPALAAARPGRLAAATRLDADALLARLDEVHVLDVRSAAERETGWLEGSQHVPLGELPARIHEVPTDRPVVVHCAGGYRSSLAASLLRAHGHRDVSDLRGGIRVLEDHPALPVRSRVDGVVQVGPHGLPTLLRDGWSLVDVREPDEWDEDHLPGATLLPLSRIQAWIDRFGPGDAVLVQCRSGRRSQGVARELRARGATAANLAGGILAVRRSQGHAPALPAQPSAPTSAQPSAPTPAQNPSPTRTP